MSTLKPKYDYSLLKVDYPDRLPQWNDKIRVICSIHGEFSVEYGRHRNNKANCQYCNGSRPTKYIDKISYGLCEKDGKKWKTRTKWKNNSYSTYRKATLKGWIDDIIPSKNKKEWTEEELMKNSKNYKIKSEWKKNNSGAYSAAIRLGILDKCTRHMEKHHNYRYSNDDIYNDAIKYNSPKEWELNSPNIYAAAIRRKIYPFRNI